MTSMEQTRWELVKADQQVDEAIVALDRLASSPVALPDAYKVYNAEVSEATKQAKEAQQRADQMREHWRDYITAWEMGSGHCLFAGDAGSSRRSVVRRCATITIGCVTRLWPTNSAYDPFLAATAGHPEDSVGPHLTPAGIEAAKPVIDARPSDAQNLKQQISAFLQEIDQVVAATTGRAPAVAASLLRALE